MEPKNDPMRDRLLAEHLPDAGKFTQYRKEVQSMLEHNERGRRREKRGMWLLWGFAVLYTTVFLLLSGLWHSTPERQWMCSLAMCAFLVVMGAVEVVKHFVNRSRVEVLKELKQVEMQVIELREMLRPGSNA
ncbi:MAG TPA: hypothetical protein VMV69_05955 [Pirellulales bacterium]|nr:hypothetical protein [Pirellulales bacterium]